MTHYARIRRLEWQSLVDLATKVGAPHGLSAAVVLQEMRRILSMLDPDQRAFFADLYARLTAAEGRELDAIRAQHGRILRGRSSIMYGACSDSHGRQPGGRNGIVGCGAVALKRR